MGLPAHLLVHTVTRIRPAATTNTYGDAALSYDVPPAASKAMPAWVQQDQRLEERTDGRDPLEQRWLLMTNDDDVQALDRIVHEGETFEVEGPPARVNTPAGFHHLEATLYQAKG